MIVPEQVSGEALEKAKSVPEEARKELMRLLDERPIISRIAVYCLASPSLRPHLKVLLPSVAFYFVNGPWRHTWVRYGVDPRQSADHRFYQILECRNIYTTSKSTLMKMPTRGRRGGIQQVRRRKVKGDDGDDDGEAAAAVGQSISISPNSHIFDGLSLNGNYFLYQLCDLVYGPTADIVNSSLNVQDEPDPKDGWYKEGILAQLREILKQRWTVLRKSAAPSYVDIAQEQANLEDILASQPSGIDSLDPSIYAGIFADDTVPFAPTTTDDDYFIFEDE